GVVVEIVKADFAVGDDAGMLRELGELFEVRGRQVFGFVGMRAYGGVNPVVLFGEGERGVEFFRAGAGADGEQRVYAGGAGAVEHGGAVVIKLREVDVRVGVD